MALSWSQETEENVNYTRLCRLLYDGGTLAVKTVFDGIVPPASLSAKLATDQHKLLKLKKPKGRVLSQDQWDQLYPPSGTCPKSEDFDITLLFVLLRNICSLTPPATGWDTLPPPKDTSLEANLVRIKYYRNNVAAHRSEAEVDEALYETYWSDISGALVSLGVKQDDIDELKSSPLGAKDYNELVEYWHLSDDDVKYQLNAIKSENSQIKNISSRIEAATTEMKFKLSEMESRMKNSPQEDELSKLSSIDYTSLIQRDCKLYHPFTRQWILDQVEENVEKSTTKSTVVVIRAGPGMGKSILAAKICDIYNQRGLLGGCHFFQHSDSLRNNPRIMLQSIARQLCSSVTGYQTALKAKLETLPGGVTISDLNCEELFGVLFEEPLSQIRMDDNVVIVIDALDECSSQSKIEIEDTLIRKLSALPSRIRFVITTRPLPSCMRLSPATQIDIDSTDPRNEVDLRIFYSDKLTMPNSEHLIDEGIKVSKGLFLVAYFVVDMLSQGSNSLSEVIPFPAHGISSVYEYYFTRIRDLIKPYIGASHSDDDNFFKMLEAVVASEIPIPKDMFYSILSLKSVDEVPRDKRKERNDAVHMLHTIFPVENDHVTVFHKSVTDWLKLDAEENPQFSVSASRGLDVLAEKCLDALKALKERLNPSDQSLVLTDVEKFAILRIRCIGLSSSISESQKNAILSDVTIVAAMLSVTTSRRFSWPTVNNVSSSSFDYLNDFLCPGSLFRYRFLLPLKLSFGHCLSVAGDLMLNHKTSPLSPSNKDKLHNWLVENNIPHHSHQIVSSLPQKYQNDWLSSFELFQVAKGLIAVSRDLQNYGITVLNIGEDGLFGKEKTLPCSCFGVVDVSPDKKYLVLTAANRRKTELYDVTTLKKVQTYNCPINDVSAYHIFGGVKHWYIVFITKDESEIYILNCGNGKVESTFKLASDERVLEASQSGYILVSSNLRGENITTHCEFYAVYFKAPDNKIYYQINQQQRLILMLKANESVDQQYSWKFSIDGDLVAICDNQTVFVFHSKTGSLFKKCDINIDFTHRKLFFLSSLGFIMRYHRVGGICWFLFYDLMLDKLVYLTPTILPYHCRLPVQPTHTSNRFIPALYGLTDKELIKLAFYNLEENIFHSA